MATDLIARGLAARPRDGAVPALASFSDLATRTIPAAVTRIDAGAGAAFGSYVADDIADGALASAHPMFCRADAGGRYFRLVPDTEGLIPVACGGANGYTGESTLVGENPIDSADSLAEFSAAPWATDNMTLDSAGIAGPDGTGTATRLTASAAELDVLYRGAEGPVLARARVKAGTAERIFLYMTQSAPDSFEGCWFDLASGTVVADMLGTGQIEVLGGGWFELVVSGTCQPGGRVGIGLADSSLENVNIGDTGIVFDFGLVEPIYQTDGPESHDDRAAIQATEDYRDAIGAPGIRFDARWYAVWRTPRDAAAPNDIHSDQSGLLFRCRSSSIWKSTCSDGTDLWRRRTDGTAMELTEFQWLDDGYAWRGGGIFTDGQSDDPGDPAVGSLTLDGIRLRGGLSYSGNHAPTDPVTGDGWDVSDKGIWQANDRYCGHITLRNGAAVTGFLGELIYTSGLDGPSRSERLLTIDDTCELGETNGSCLNPNGITLRVGRCLCYNAFIGIEGWTGEDGRLAARFRNCVSNTLQGGTVNTSGPGGYFEPTRPTPERIPLGRLDIRLEQSGGFLLGHWLTGRIESFDTDVAIGNVAAFAHGSKELDVEIVSWVDQANSVAGLQILGAGAGAMSIARVSIRLSCKRTAHAIANGFRHLSAVYTYGSVGPDVVVEFRTLEGVAGPLTYAGPSYDYRITIRNYVYDVYTATGSGYFDIEANAGGVLPLVPAVALSSTNNGVFSCALPVTGINTGTEMVVANFTDNFVSGGAALRLSYAGGLRQSGDVILPPGFDSMRLVFDGARWTVAEPPPPLGATAGWDPGAIAVGGQATIAVPVIGASVGDKVDAGFSADLQGLILTAYVSAPGTVTALLANLTGTGVDLPSGVLSVTVRA